MFLAHAEFSPADFPLPQMTPFFISSPVSPHVIQLPPMLSALRLKSPCCHDFSAEICFSARMKCFRFGRPTHSTYPAPMITKTAK